LAKRLKYSSCSFVCACVEYGGETFSVAPSLQRQFFFEQMRALRAFNDSAERHQRRQLKMKSLPRPS
jgi:hypothetical protein